MARRLVEGSYLWHTTFEGEGGADHGGLFRESLRCVCAELQSDALPVFMPVPNASYSVGDNQDTWMPAPVGSLGGLASRAWGSASKKESAATQRRVLHFLGSVMAGCLRSRNSLEVRRVRS